MPLETEDFLQADKLIQVGEAVAAVAAGKFTYGEIEAYLGLSSEGRQGRYYRLAAEKLGLIINYHNHAQITDLGVEFLNSTTPEARMDFLARCLTEVPIFRDALIYIGSYKPTDDQIKLWHRSIYPGAKSTADRRLSTLLSYLRDSGMVSKKGGKNFLTKYFGAVYKIELPANEPLTGTEPPSQAPVFKDATKALLIEADSQKLERASAVHWRLINAKATAVLKLGIEPKSNPSIDLFAETPDQLIIYEMKSITHGGANAIAQIRRAVAQLYEYRYIYNRPTAILSIVTNYELLGSQKWIASYLAKDRRIAYEWTADFTEFKADANSAALLG